MHPVRTARHAVTPRPVRQVSRALYTVTNPLGAAENALIGSALRGRSRRSRSDGASRGRSSSQVTVTVSGVRATEAVEVHDALEGLFAVQRERFAPTQAPVLPYPQPEDPTKIAAVEWARRKGEVPVWRVGARKKLRGETTFFGQVEATCRFQIAQEERQRAQGEADRWWLALTNGHAATVGRALKAAFADNVAPVGIEGCDGFHATLVLVLPGPEVLPSKKAHITPSGRLSSKRWTKTELNAVYAELLGAHLLATLRETWAVAPSLKQTRVVGARPNGRSADILFDVNVLRSQTGWHEDGYGSAILDEARWGLHRTGRTGEVCGWPTNELSGDISVIDGAAGQSP
jgi:hypothetical protein